MLITKECDYGVRIIRALSTGEKKTVEAICGEELIPEQYAYKIIKKLNRAGFVKSLRGRDGGYQLCKSLDTFTLYDIIVAIDENLFIFDCLREDKPCTRKEEMGSCAVHVELDRLQGLLGSEMQRKTVQQVFDEADLSGLDHSH